MRTRFRRAALRPASQFHTRSLTALLRRASCCLGLIVATLFGTVTAASAQAPAVASVSPNSGPETGGTSVTIAGGSFNTATAVRFGATNATSFSINSNEQITAVAPPGTGTVDVTVTNPSGTSFISPIDRFTYTAVAPTVTSVSPAAGPTAGGTTVTITGTSFSTATAVSFGGSPAIAFTVNSSTRITATAPAGAGTVDITVTTPAGTSPASAADRYSYVAAPTITSIAPASGPATGGTSVAISGTGFTGATVVKFGAANATSFTVNSATSITATSPAGIGTVDITVTTAGGTSATSAADRFTYVGAPTVTSVAPASGPAAGGTSVTISGTGFTGATVVKFGAANATSFTVNSATSITAAAPAGTGTVDITVTTLGGTSATSAADQFAYTSAPTVTSISPATGPAAGGTSVTITGANFTGATVVKFGASNAAGFTVNSATSITATSPAGAGTVDITVTTAAGTSAISAADRYSYATPATQIAVTSSQNPSSYGQSVTFTATVTASGGMPSGTVTFNDNGTPIGSAALTAGSASFAISSLAVGNHTITASYAGNGTFTGSTSPPLAQSVGVPADSTRLRALQLNVTKLVAQESGQAISGAIDNAISEGFSEGGGSFVTPGGTGMRINFAAGPSEEAAQGGASDRSSYASDTARANGRSGRNPRVDDAFAAIDRQMPAKAPPRKYQEARDWMFWIDVRGSGIDRWPGATAPGTAATQSSLYGSQVNALMGLTYRAAPDVLVGAIAGYETFSYTEQDINGKLTGDGWTVGSYLGWRITPTLRYDAAVAYSQIGYNGISGAAQGSFTGNRWLFATGLTGTYRLQDLLIEPSARVYALWEHENAYVDTLGTLQTARDFTSGRASGGVKLSYPMAWLDSVALAPYFGVYGDYYFSRDDAAALAAGGLALASTPQLDGWSARLTGGLNARLSGGAMLGAGAEYGGLGSDVRIWRFTAKARVPF